MRRGDNAYIIESSRIIRPVRILSCAGGLYLVKFLDSSGAIRVHPDRLYTTREAADLPVDSRRGGVEVPRQKRLFLEQVVFVAE